MQNLSLKNLLAQLEAWDDAYFNGEGEISDPEYDALRRYYEKKSGRPYERVGAPVRPKNIINASRNKSSESVREVSNKVRLPYFMGSVDRKVKDDGIQKYCAANSELEVDREENSVQKELDLYAKKYPGPWLVSDKIDGNAGQYITEQGITKLYSKGDGFEGEDISGVLQYLNLPLPSGDCVIRGELVLPKDQFELYVQKRRQEGDKRKLTSIRSVGSGMLNRDDDHDPEIMSQFLYIAFQVQSKKLSAYEHYQLLEKQGFQVPRYRILEQLDAKELEELLETALESANYEMDGFVIAPAHTAYDFPADRDPRHMVAFKIDDCEVTTVTHLVWLATAKGTLRPKVYYEPTLLSSALCKKATAHNAKFVFKHKIGPGSEILVCRGGNIIPRVVCGITPCEKYQLPEVDYEWDATQTHFLIVDPDQSREVRIRRMVHFAEHLKIDGLQKGRVEILFEHGIDTIGKLLEASVEDIAACPRLGTKSAQALRDSIDSKIKQASLVQVMTASNVFGTGFAEKKLGSIVKAHPNILEYAYADPGIVTNMLLEIGGFAKMAAVFEERLPYFVEWLEDHPAIELAKYEQQEEDVEGNTEECEKTLLGESIVLTGFSAAVKEDLAARVRKAGGGECKAQVSGKTTILVVLDRKKSSGKVAKMSSRGQILSKEEFLKKYNL